MIIISKRLYNKLKTSTLWKFHSKYGGSRAKAQALISTEHMTNIHAEHSCNISYRKKALFMKQNTHLWNVFCVNQTHDILWSSASFLSINKILFKKRKEKKIIRISPQIFIPRVTPWTWDEMKTSRVADLFVQREAFTIRSEALAEESLHVLPRGKHAEKRSLIRKVGGRGGYLK